MLFENIVWLELYDLWYSLKDLYTILLHYLTWKCNLSIKIWFLMGQLVFVVPQHVKTDNRIIRIVQNLSPFAVRGVRIETCFFFAALPEMSHNWANTVNECQQVPPRIIISCAILLLNAVRNTFSPTKEIPIYISWKVLGKWFPGKKPPKLLK